MSLQAPYWSVAWICRAVGFGCLLAAWSTAQAGGALFPGDRPGPARLSRAETQITLGNDLLRCVWSTDSSGLRWRTAEDLKTGTKLEISGEVFEVVLADGTRYPASSLRATGGPIPRTLMPRPAAAQAAARSPAQVVEIPLRSTDDHLQATWRAVLQDDANYVRQELDLAAAGDDLAIREIVWSNQPLPGAHTAGRVDGSPVVAGSFFLGCEDPMAANVGQPPARESGTPVALCSLPRNAELRRGEVLQTSFVLGVAPADQMRRAFLYYLERERAHPYRPFLHYNSWYDVAWKPFEMNEAKCLDAIHVMGDKLVRRHQVRLDSMVFDDGWDNPRTLWQFHSGFPRGFTPLAEACRQYDTRLGVWLSPFGGYGEPKKQRIEYGRQQGLEINDTGFSLAGPKYYAVFKQACVDMIRKYGVNHFKFDGIAKGMSAAGGGEYVRDTQAMRRLMLELRQESPGLFINLTTGSWPSPFWLRYADSIWRQGGDMGFAGPGPRQQQWLTYRDQEVYRNIVCRAPLYPLNSLMTQGVAYSRQGSAGDPSFNSAGFRDDVWAFFGGGTCLQELYIQPAKLTDADWSVLARAARWSRDNGDVLVDTHWIGGDPTRLEVYGYASWSPRKGTVMLRNPDDKPQTYDLDVQRAFELPLGAGQTYVLQSVPPEPSDSRPLRVSAGTPIRIALDPLEVLVFDAIPQAPEK